MRRDGRVRVKLIISVLPGVHLRQLQRLLGVSFNSTRYHVERMAKIGEIVRVEDGGHSRLYPPGLSDREKDVCSLIRGGTDRRILARLVMESGLSNKQLCDLTGLAKSTVSEHLAHQIQLGIVVTRRTIENGIVYDLEDPIRIRSLLGKQSPALLKKATDRFVDLWNF